ncbi:MAG: hypothetical protein LBI12_04305 [Treponema sp.]|nr:hypothetical protein [Treponema sp.]
MIAFVLVAVLVTGTAFAQFDLMSYPPPLSGGNVLFDGGIGMAYTGYDGKWAFPPVFIQAEYCLPMLPLSVGASVSFYRWKYELSLLSVDYGFTLTVFTPAARVNWHWGLNIDWLDIYTGISLGYQVVNAKYNSSAVTTGAAASTFYWGGQAGARFYFTENIGAMIETGYPYWAKAGIALKF